MENIAILTAGGIGSRTTQIIPKQFISIYDKPIILYTMEAFQKNPEITSIVVVCLNGWEKYLQTYANQYNITKLKKIVIGGSSNYESILAGISAVKEFAKDDDIVMIHDGNRPLISDSIITNNIRTAKEFGNAITYIPTTEVVFMHNGQNDKPTLLDRDKLIRTQTPHTAKLGFMIEVYERAEKENLNDKAAFCSVLSSLGYTIHFVEGNALNFKITFKEDIKIFKGLVSLGDKDNDLQ